MPLYIGRPAALKVQVDHIEHHIVRKLYPGMQDRSLPGDLPGLDLLRMSGYFFISGCGGIMVKILIAVNDLVAAEDD